MSFWLDRPVDATTRHAVDTMMKQHARDHQVRVQAQVDKQIEIDRTGRKVAPVDLGRSVRWEPPVPKGQGPKKRWAMS